MKETATTPRRWRELEQSERHRIIIEALEAPEGERNGVARRHNVHREHMYKQLREIRQDPARWLEEANREAAHRRRVVDLLRKQAML